MAKNLCFSYCEHDIFTICLFVVYVSASMRHMVQLNGSSNSGGGVGGGETVFSILIYDRHGQDIIAPLLSVKQLRQMGVTLHMSVWLLEMLIKF